MLSSLESAARLRSQIVDLKSAYPIVKDVLDRAGNADHLDVIHESSLLLTAEY